MIFFNTTIQHTIKTASKTHSFQLNQSLDLSNNANINSVDLPEPLHDNVYNTYEKRTAMIAGFGVSDVETYNHNTESVSNVIYPDTVQVAKVWIMPQVECQNIWSKIKKIEPTMMCGRILGPGFRGVCKVYILFLL